MPPRWRSIRFRLAPRTYAPWGVRVVPGRLTKSRKIPTRKTLPLFMVSRADAKWTPTFKCEVPRRQPFNATPMGGQFDFVWLSARTPHGGASYVW